MKIASLQAPNNSLRLELTTIIIAGENLELHPAGALWWSQQKLLVVADLHLEKGSFFAKSGTYLPPYDTESTLTKLEKLIERFDPTTVIALGDSFHDRDAARRLPISSQVLINKLQQNREWIWVTGNHDPEPPQNLKGETAEMVQINNLTFVHEPTTSVVTGEVAGHLHPCTRLHLNGRKIRRFCFAENSQRLILPAFGTYTGGLNVLDPAWEPYFKNAKFQVHVLGAKRLYTLPTKSLIPD